ncbi:hypothetical protein EJ07DRAFT_164529 [Lizonia empirigonia]|nr:hypothetical protein EJ07DRAFT_164529 [Lizonia empirigonia]
MTIPQSSTVPMLHSYINHAAAALLQLTLGSSLATGSSNVTSVSSFDELIPSADLVWTPCFQNFTCSLLEVPLDYSNKSVGSVNLAIIKRPGDTDDAQEILVNPGGPGGSSVAMAIGDYEAIQEKIGTQYSLVGIDPRGVGNSGPSSDFFAGYSYIARNSFLAEVFTPPDITSDYTLRTNHEYMCGYGNWCSSVYAVNNTANYASTVVTVQDMLHYIELSADSKGEPPESAKLWYYGISYGTILGSTFASLEDHFNGGWEKSIVDNDEVSRYFFKRCFEAGPVLCHFHQNASSWQELEQRYADIMQKLLDAPIAVGNLGLSKLAIEALGLTLTPALFTWQDLINFMFTTAYLLTPASFTGMDTILTELEAGPAYFLTAIPVKAQISSTSPDFDERTARTLVNCLDANRRFNTSEFSQYKSFVEDMHNASSYGGLNAVYLNGPICSHLNVAPSKCVPRVPSTSAPILLVSMLFDPVTPLPAAQKMHSLFMHSLFPGSGLLVGNNSGHCAHFQKSACLSKFEKQYMLDGTLPPPGTSCEVDEPNPFIIVAEQSNSTAGILYRN